MKLRNHLLRFGVILLILCLVTACTPGTRPPVGDCSHTDADDNGHCDDCGLSVIVLLDLYAINDLHGKLADGDTHPGVDEMTTYLKTAMAADDHGRRLLPARKARFTWNSARSCRPCAGRRA